MSYLFLNGGEDGIHINVSRGSTWKPRVYSDYTCTLSVIKVGEVENESKGWCDCWWDFNPTIICTRVHHVTKMSKTMLKHFPWVTSARMKEINKAWLFLRIKDSLDNKVVPCCSELHHDPMELDKFLLCWAAKPKPTATNIKLKLHMKCPQLSRDEYY